MSLSPARAFSRHRSAKSASVNCDRRIVVEVAWMHRCAPPMRAAGRVCLGRSSATALVPVISTSKDEKPGACSAARSGGRTRREVQEAF